MHCNKEVAPGQNKSIRQGGLWGTDTLLKRAVSPEILRDPAPKFEQFTQSDRKMIAQSMQEIALEKISKGDERNGWSLIRESDRFKVCGCEYLNLSCERDNLSFYVPVTCKSRICPECGRSLYGRMVGKVKEVVGNVLSKRKKGYFLTLVTLTFNKGRFGEDLPCREQIERCYAESGLFLRQFFGKYRMKRNAKGELVPEWSYKLNDRGRKVRDKKKWRGGGFIATMEVGHDNNNLHIHAVCYGHFESYAGMQKEWAKITGDSVVANFEPVWNPAKAANYVLKYITKPPATDSYIRMAGYAGMVKGTRRLRTGGIFYNALTLPERETLESNCPFCADRLKFRGYNHAENFAGSARCALLMPLLKTVRDRGSLLPTWSFSYWDTLAGTDCKDLLKTGKNLHN